MSDNQSYTHTATEQKAGHYTDEPSFSLVDPGMDDLQQKYVLPGNSLHASNLEAHVNAPVRAATILRAQGVHGNRAVQRVVKGSSSPGYSPSTNMYIKRSVQRFVQRMAASHAEEGLDGNAMARRNEAEPEGGSGLETLLQAKPVASSQPNTLSGKVESNEEASGRTVQRSATMSSRPRLSIQRTGEEDVPWYRRALNSVTSAASAATNTVSNAVSAVSHAANWGNKATQAPNHSNQAEAGQTLAGTNPNSILGIRGAFLSPLGLPVALPQYLANSYRQQAAANPRQGILQNLAGMGRAELSSQERFGELVQGGTNWASGVIQGIQQGVSRGAQGLANQARGIPVVGTLAQGTARNVDIGARAWSGLSRSVVRAVGGVGQILANPVGTAAGLWRIGEQLPAPISVANPLRAMRGVYNVATGQTGLREELNNVLNPRAQWRERAAFFGQMGSHISEPWRRDWRRGDRIGAVTGAFGDIAPMLSGLGEASGGARAGTAANAARAGEAAGAARAGEAATAARAGEFAGTTRAGGEAAGAARAGEVAGEGAVGTRSASATSEGSGATRSSSSRPICSCASSGSSEILAIASSSVLVMAQV